jgi:hypothetical protein
LTVASHASPDRGIVGGISYRGFLELDSVWDATPRLFLDGDARDKYVPIFGTITTFPADEAASRDVLPYVSLYGRLPDAASKKQLRGLFAIENVRYALKASPDYNTASRKWEASCALTWVADLILAPPSTAAESAHPGLTIPVMLEIEDKDGPVRFRADLTEGLAVAWNLLAGCVPGTRLSIPGNGFNPSKDVRLTEFEILAERDEHRELHVDWVRLTVQTNEDHERWPLIDGLLTLDAIDFHILVRIPPGERGVQFSLSGLIGIGESGVLRLTADVDLSGREVDYLFSGQLVAKQNLKMGEVVSHFLGNSARPELPALEVSDFSFSVAPRSKRYNGEIVLEGDWRPIPDFPLVIRNVFFRLAHEAGEGDTTFQAFGAFELGGAFLFVSADYVSNGGGWTFSGGTYEDGKIPIGNWLHDIKALLGPGLAMEIPLPTPLQGLELSGIKVRFNTATRDFSFTGIATFPVDGRTGGDSETKLTVQVDIVRGVSTFHGSLLISKYEFSVDFLTKDRTGLLVATYDGSKADSVELRDFVSRISTAIGGMIPSGMSLNLGHAQLAYGKKDAKSKFLFGVELDAGIQLSNLPLVGPVFDRDQTLSVVFQILAVNDRFEKAEIEAINQLTIASATKLPDESIGPPQSQVQLKAAVHFGGINQQLDLPLATNIEPARSGPAQTTQHPAITMAAGGEATTRWVNIQKALGPFHFQRLGIGVSSGKIAFLLDASLEAAGLTLSLNGLGAECSFESLSKHQFLPAFHLDGLGIDFRKGDLEIGGALLSRPGGTGGPVFDGAATIHYKQLGIEAIGSYRTFDDHPSLFVYALIDYPLGGPAFFFVEGGAVGFGYNRTLLIPRFEAVSEFPLVKQATSRSGSKAGPMEIARDLDRHIEPAVGEYFIAAGIRFSSFKTIEGFVLLTVLFGEHFEIDVLGKATLTSPPKLTETGQPPLMSAALTLLGRYLPDQGFLSIMAQLAPDAHIFSPDCHITGGFAFYSWFDNAPGAEERHKGDFVLTLGGYHKAFSVPAHYPRVPRLGLNWLVNPNLSLKADAYFALTPSARMVGGHLQANWQSGNLRAWFNAEVDFLVGWEPYHYEGTVSVTIGASYRFQFFGWRTVSVELAADLAVWGPPFSGKAHVRWYIISFDVSFGNQTRTAPAPIKWNDFRKSFLPNKNMYVVSARAGKVASHGRQPEENENPNKSGHLGIINPRELCIAVSAAMPIKQNWSPLGPRGAMSTEPRVGIAPMNKKHEQWRSTLQITIMRGGHDETSKFEATPATQSMPKALWGETMAPDVGASRLIDSVICGYDIRPKEPIKATAAGRVSFTEKRHSRPSPQKAVLVRSDLGDPYFLSGIGFVPVRQPGRTRTMIKDNLGASSVRATREAILRDLLPEADTDWGGVTVEAWRAVPRIVEIVGEPVISGGPPVLG